MKAKEAMLLLTIATISHQSVDLNLRQLQFVSDHLTTTECRRLITALHQKSFQLTDWNTMSGTETTVEDLTVRLHQIGRADIAHALAQAVYGETSMKLHKYFLDNPFKAMVDRHGSRLMEDDDDEEVKKTKLVKAVDNSGPPISNRHFPLAVICLTLTLTVLGCMLMVTYCSASFYHMCPKMCVATFEAIQESIKDSLATIKSLLGQKPSQATTSQTAARLSPDIQQQTEKLVQDILTM